MIWIERACYVVGALLLLGAGAAWTVAMVFGLGLAGDGLLLLGVFLSEDRIKCESIARMQARIDELHR